MKSRFLLLMSLIWFSCQQEDATPVDPINDGFNPANAMLIKMGNLAGIGHTVSGKASLYTEGSQATLLLDPFMSQNGPDLKVYLSQDANASQYISLGALKSINGKQSYAIPAGTNLALYTHVHIWCEQFSVVFGRAELQ